jgi:hypothetical protein
MMGVERPRFTRILEFEWSHFLTLLSLHSYIVLIRSQPDGERLLYFDFV